jgi:hypothetical protein
VRIKPALIIILFELAQEIECGSPEHTANVKRPADVYASNCLNGPLGLRNDTFPCILARRFNL